MLSYLKLQRKHVLVLSQRDIKHPKAGGAEVYTHKALIQLAKKIPVVHFSAYHDSQKFSEEIIDGIYYIRGGRNLLSVIIEGYKFYKNNEENVIAVIDHSNTHQFFTFLWAKEKRIFFVHQLAVEIWQYFYGEFYGKIFRYLEKILIKNSRGVAITVSKSTYNDLKEHSFDDIYICPEGNCIKNNVLPNMEEKQEYLIYVGRLVPYKGVDDAIRIAKEVNKKLVIIGSGDVKYVNKLKKLASEINSDCEFKGYVSSEEKDELIANAYLLLMPSIREGWGLVITESANLGTPSIVYPVNGVVEAVNEGNAGWIAKDVNWESMVEIIENLKTNEYNEIRKKAFEFSLTLNWENTSTEFLNIIEDIFERRNIKYDKSEDLSYNNQL